MMGLSWVQTSQLPHSYTLYLQYVVPAASLAAPTDK